MKNCIRFFFIHLCHLALCSQVLRFGFIFKNSLLDLRKVFQYSIILKFAEIKSWLTPFLIVSITKTLYSSECCSNWSDRRRAHDPAVGCSHQRHSVSAPRVSHQRSLRVGLQLQWQASCFSWYRQRSRRSCVEMDRRYDGMSRVSCMLRIVFCINVKMLEIASEDCNKFAPR